MSNTVRASHILAMFKGSMRSSNDRSQADAQTLMNDLKQQITDGGDFAALAKEHSDCPSGQQGGDLGQFGRGQMVKEFEESAFGMQVGETSDIVVTDFGYHLIQRTG